MRTAIITRTIAVVATALVAGCGGTDSEKTADKDALPVSGAEATKVSDVARAVITDSEKTCSLLTDSALGTFTGGKEGERGRAQCQTQVDKGRLPKQATVVVLEMKGTTASVGYTTPVVTGAMQLVKDGDRWLMDRSTTVAKQ